jgi:hypothetical protein
MSAPSATGTARPRKRRIRSPLETIAIPLTLAEVTEYASWRERQQSLGVPALHVLRFASWYGPAMERWVAKAVEAGFWGGHEHWDDRGDNYCRRPDAGLAHRTGDDRLTVHLEVEDDGAGARLVVRYCRTAGPAMPPPRWTDAQRLSFEELVSGVACRGCGRGFSGGPEWKPVMQRTPEDQVALDAEEAAFKQLHPDCDATRWSISGGGVTHCSVCCPPPPFGPEQTRHVPRLLAEAATEAAVRDRDLERRWRELRVPADPRRQRSCARGRPTVGRRP